MTFLQSHKKLGIIANEFFDPTVSRVGGFGMLSRQIVRCAEQVVHPKLNVHLFYAEQSTNKSLLVKKIYDHPAHIASGRWRRDNYKLILARARPDLWLSIDYRPNYEYFIKMEKRVPLIMWVQDPKTPEDWDRIRTCFVPGQEGVKPQGLGHIDCLPLSNLYQTRRDSQIQTVFTVPAKFLLKKIPATYGVSPEDTWELCYPMEPIEGPFVKSEVPLVTFLGRLDPQKRPWVAAEVARRMPDVKFQFLGKSHFTGPGAWLTDNLPANVELVGHVDGADKVRRLRASWLMLNTSIHEGLPISFVEGLQCNAPIVACVNPENIVAQFGAYVGEYRGSGMEAVDTFVVRLRELLDDPARRAALGVAGCEWARVNHSQQRFVRQFEEIYGNLTVSGRSPLPRTGH